MAQTAKEWSHRRPIKYVVNRRDLGQRIAASLVSQERPVVETTSRNNHGEQAMDQKGVTSWQKQVRASQSEGDAMDEKEAT